MISVEQLLAGATASFKPVLPKVAEVRDETLTRRINDMAARGYIFNAVTIEAMIAYLQGYGVLLSGRVGVGKTHFFRMLGDDIVILNVSEANGWLQSEVEDWIEYTRGRDVMLDDIGSGGAKARDYGREYDALLMILNAREPYRCKRRTHFTTNLTNDQLVDTFDARVVDRIYGLAKCFRLPDLESMREASPLA